MRNIFYQLTSFCITAFLSFALAVPQTTAQTFGEADLERLIMNHKMMKNYDRETGHFKNTPHELKNISDLKAENASKAAEILNISLLERENSKTAIFDDIKDEDSFWNSTFTLSRRKKQLEYQIIKNDELISSNGDPGHTKLYPIIDEICNDIFTSLYRKNQIMLNKLPRYPSKKPELNGKDLHNFWYHPNSETLYYYLSQSSIIAQIFPRSDNTIIYQKKGK